MSVPYGIERRDPASGVLSLGRILTRARNDGESGRLDVQGKDRVHAIHVSSGAVTGIDSIGSEQRFFKPNIRQHIESIFSLPRPHVIWKPDEHSESALLKVDPNFVVVSGITTRQDLFDPRPLLDRIPVETLRIDPSMARLIRTMPLRDDERMLIERLAMPTPIPMILWKRGLHPRHAGALLVALNLTGCFAGHWEPGDLPRSSLANTIRRKLKSGCKDLDLLGVSENASSKELDRAFRKLSYELHPDRVNSLPEHEAARAVAAFTGVSQAYDRIRRSRRSRPVRCSDAQIGRVELKKQSVSRWTYFLQEAQRAKQNGDRKRAHAFAIKALASNPPESAKRDILGILKHAA